ncbi:hypothetical protein [Lysinibacillus sp. JNUCC-52]|uniref:hypothetical protein n=1 Tax=Lysinibacillus sp. JNUCC-52 TaxID=2792480 RepID=UPI0019356C9D|nr:hypothetical protein JNUCC52_02840 [Lysinibacillus sp. JNUCC-52]
MSTYELWEKMIKGKVYTKDTATKRVSMIGLLLSDDEFQSLVALIGTVYGE